MEKNHRIEKDSLGEIKVAKDKYWGAQTQRALHHFSSALEIMPKPLLIALAIIKKASAQANKELNCLDKTKADLIIQVADEIIDGHLFDHFPLHIWQTGSGTQSNMNVNEVIANRANELLGYCLGNKSPIHPNDHVNMSQSTNDAFPTAMHIASVLEVKNELMPALEKLQKVLKEKSLSFKDIIKVGRTHLMDAVPITIGQEFSGYIGQIKFASDAIKHSLESFYPLALGGTAVGTGINTHPQFAKLVASKIAKITNLPFKSAPNKFTAISSHDTFVSASGALKTLACSLIKICSDISFMASGPRSGLGEFILPQNEPGSSIMAGKVNPTQCEALTMASIQVIANDTAISMGASRGNFQINAYKPLIIYNYLQSIRILSQSIENFIKHLLKGIKPNKKNIKEHLDRSLMLATSLNPILGYDKCAEIVRFAEKENCTIKEAVLKLNYLTSELFDKYVDPKKMV